MPLSKKRVKPRTFFDDAEDRFDGAFSSFVFGFGVLGAEFSFMAMRHAAFVPGGGLAFGSGGRKS